MPSITQIINFHQKTTDNPDMGAEPLEDVENGFSNGQKTLNCIVDETALIDDVKQSNEDGIKKWVSAGLINLFISLHSKYNRTAVLCRELSVC